MRVSPLQHTSARKAQTYDLSPRVASWKTLAHSTSRHTCGWSIFFQAWSGLTSLRHCMFWGTWKINNAPKSRAPWTYCLWLSSLFISQELWEQVLTLNACYWPRRYAKGECLSSARPPQVHDKPIHWIPLVWSFYHQWESLYWDINGFNWGWHGMTISFSANTNHVDPCSM